MVGEKYEKTEKTSMQKKNKKKVYLRHLIDQAKERTRISLWY